MVAINQEDLIGSVVPDIYINRITLETSGAPIIEDNPHIDHEREKISQIQEEDSDTLIVKIDFLLKEKLTDDVIGSWFGNIDIGKYLEMKIFQVTDPKLTSFLSISSDAIEIIDPRRVVEKNDIRFRLAAKVMGTRTIDDTLLRLERTSDSRIISVKKDVEGNDSKLSQFKSSVDDDGNVVYDITYRTQFEIPNSKPEHLAYFAISSFDIVQLARDFDLDLDRSSLKEVNGKITSEIVIDNYNVVSRSFIFYDEDNRIWAGAAHQDKNGQWMSKSRPQTSSVPLTRTVVSNVKVQDFRNVKEIERLTIDFSVIERKVLSRNLTKRLTNDIIESKREESYFSDILLARDADGDAKFFFSVDMEKAIINKTLFGNLIKKTPRLRQELIRGTQIRAMRVYRQRVREDFSLSRAGTPIGLSPFDKNEAWELIINSGEKSWKTFSTVNNSVGSLREFDLATTEDLIGVRHFSGMDKTMSEVTDGVYRYIVEMEVDDNTPEFVEKKIRELLNAKSELESYLSLGSQSSMSKYLAEVRDPHIDSPSEFAGTTGSTAGTYDSISNRFTQYFVNMMSKRYPQRRSAPWVSSILVYANILDLFTGVFSSKRNRSNILNALYSFTSPKTGNPSGVASVIRLVDNLITVLSSAIGTTVTTSPRKFRPGSSQRSSIHSLSRSLKRTFMISRSFDQIFDSEVVKGVGADYLSRGEDETVNNDGLRFLRADDYIKRVELETLRFYMTLEPDINLSFAGNTITDNDAINATSFTYLTPARIDMPGRSLILLEGDLSRQLGNSRSQDNPSVPFETRKSKRSRKVERIEEGDVPRDEKLLELKTALLYTNSSDFPVDPIINRNIEGGHPGTKLGQAGKEANDNLKISKETSLASLKGLGSLLNLDLRPIRIKPVRDADANVILTPESEIDLIPEITTACQTPDARVEEPDDNRDDMVDFQLDSLKTLLSIIMVPSVQLGNFRRSKRLMRKPNFKLQKGPQSFRKRTSSALGLMNVRNLKVRNIQEGPQEGTRIIQGLNHTIIEKDFKKLPNQLKAVFLQSTVSDIVRRERFTNLKTVGIKSRVRAEADINFTFQMINKVTFLEGFRKDGDGNILIREPIWTDLTERQHDTLIGQSILCRMTPYENSTVGIKRNKGLEVAVYDEYFILVPKKVKRRLPSIPINFNPGVLTKKIINDIRITLPNVDIVQTSTDKPIILELDDNNDLGLTSDLSDLVKIDIVETDSGGRTTETSYDFADTSALTPAPGNQTETVMVGAQESNIPVGIILPYIANDCQTDNLEPQYITNNFVNFDSVEEILRNLPVVAPVDPDCPPPKFLRSETPVTDRTDERTSGERGFD